MAGSTGEQPGPESQEKAEFVRKAYGELAKLWEEGDDERFPWVREELTRIEQEADELNQRELKERLRDLYARYRDAKRSSKGQASR